MNDFQFFNKKRIEEIINKENDLLLRRRDIEKTLREVRPREKREENAFTKQRVKEMTAPVSEGGAGGCAGYRFNMCGRGFIRHSNCHPCDAS